MGILDQLDKNYIASASKLNGEFYVLTCGEHEGNRGVNRLVESSLNWLNSLRKGIFQPYSPVKTNILIIDKKLKKK